MGIFDRWRAREDWGAPNLGVAVDEARLLAVDMETTALDPKKGQIVSLGWVPVNGQVIDLSGAGYAVVRGAQVTGDAHLHLLTQEVVDAGVALEEAISQLRGALEGRALLVHFAGLEVGFLRAAARRLGWARPRLSVVDTFALERRHMERMGTYPRGEDLRLPRVRERYGLPRYRNHNALSDALACAELYLALDLHGRRLGECATRM
ncbi:exonuclease domain-containing protein [Corynebacterium sp.]|uniref:3'-5' exonuclease n=1 Tax=Corynebacterium sp. TaxID=1720 RepID=UPI0026DC3E3D|nr:exonuclease domain-containing protein [Corynebacterium sp.]MDO5031477.1 exonuclease domain-containing protein [Corynebacterium sp.]